MSNENLQRHPDCACCKAWHQEAHRIIKNNCEQAIINANAAMTKEGEGLTLNQRQALIKAIQEA